jgi:hypothetical protein
MFILYNHCTSSLHQTAHVIKKLRPVTTEQRVAIILLKVKSCIVLYMLLVCICRYLKSVLR